MNTPTQATPTVKRMSAGKRDLTKAVEQVHQKAKRVRRSVPTPKVTLEEIDALPEELLLAPGDSPKRKSFFDHDDSRRSVQLAGRKKHVILEDRVALPDYRTKANKRHHRSMMTIPPGLRANIRAAFGVDNDDEIPMTTAIIALADYAAMMLKKEGRCLVVQAVKDEKAAERKAAKKLVRNFAKQSKGRSRSK